MIKHKQHIIILFLFIGYFQPISASSFSVEEAANKIIIGDTDIHYSEVLRIIAKYGHQLSPDIKAELQKARPNWGFEMEESGTIKGTDPDAPTWIVDPLDGTTNFLHGIPHFAISIAVRDKSVWRVSTKAGDAMTSG
mgnify:CR=1 FL=1